MSSVEAVLQTSIEPAITSIRDWNYPVTAMGQVSTHSTFPLHRQVLNNGKIRGQLCVSRAIKDCIPLIHGPTGCAFQTKICAMRPWDEQMPTPCTDFTEKEAIYGGNEKLEDAIVDTYERYGPEMILVISTCASDLTGDDFPGVVEDAKQKVPCDIVYTTGTCTERRRRVGDQDALYSIVDQLIEDCDTVENSVNLIAGIGFPPPRAHFQEVSGILEECGIGINGIYFDSNTVDELKAIPRAELNVASGHSPFSWIELAERKFGTETLDIAKMMYTIELDEVPYGIKGTLNLLERIGDHFGIGGEIEAAGELRAQETNHILEKYRKKTEGLPVAIGARGMPMSGTEIIMIRELGMTCKLLTFRFNTLKGFFNRKTLRWLEERVLRFLSIYQEYEPEVLIDPTVEEEVEAFKKSDVKLIVPNALAHPGRYAGSGIPVFTSRYSKYHGFGSLGFGMPIAVAEDVLWSLNNGIGRNTLLSLIDYNEEWPRFDEHWANLAEMFQEMWYHEMVPEN